MSAKDGSSSLKNSQRLENQPFDEAFDIDDGEDVASNIGHTPTPKRSDRRDDKHSNRGNTPPRAGPLTDDDSDGYDDHAEGVHGGGNVSARSPSLSSDDDADDLRHTPGSKLVGGYNSSNYDHLKITPDIKELFAHITQYKPRIQEIETMLKPFIPDYIPAVGDIDAFIKIARPDKKDNGLGLTIIDEPCAAQSDSTVLDLQLREITKTASTKATKVKVVEHGQDVDKAIDSWVHSIKELHRERPPQSVNYSSPMPDIESLMQQWPEQFEQLLNTVQLPSADLDIPLKDYADIICAILDIPVGKSRIQSLHVLFTLFSEFKALQLFNVEPTTDGLAIDGNAL